MKKSIFLFFAAILCAMNASAWSYKTSANGWTASTSGFKNVTMNSGKTVDVVMLKDVGDGVNICQNDNGSGHTLYCKWTKTSGDIFRGTARWNNGLYCDETVVVPGGKVYIKVGSGTQVQMTAGTDYTYTADVTFSNTGQSYTISGGTVSGATIKNENSMPSGGKPASLTMKNSYTSKNAGSVHIVFDLRTNKVTETVESAPEPVADVTIYFVNTKSWPSVNAYVWGTGDPYKAWPGEAMTSTGDKAHGYDVYSYTFPETYTNCIFNGNGQTDDLTVNAGQYYDIASKTWYATLADVPNPTPAVMETVYFINTGNWGKVNAYAWTSSDNGWPGAEMTQEAEQIAGYDVYSFTAEQGQWANLIFNNGEGTQTGDLTWQAGKYYAPSKDTWYADAAAAEAALTAPVVTYDYYIAGPLAGGWNATQMGMEKVAEGQYACEFTKDAGDYQFKVTNGKWGNETGGFDCADVEGAYEEVSNVDGNVNVKLTATTTFTVKFNSNTKKISFEGLTPAETKYYIAGTQNLTGFDWKENGLQLTKDGDLYKHTFSALPAGVFEFKVTNGTWTNPWGYSNLGAAYVEVSEGTDGEGNPNGNIKFVTEEAKNITVIFDPAAGKITFNGLTVITYVLMGVDGDWTTGIPMTKDGDQYVCKDVTIDGVDDAVKVVTLTNGTATAWYNKLDNYSNTYYYLGFGEDDNLVLNGGVYDFYFKLNEEKIYIEQKVYTRKVTNKYGTICLPYASASTSGATFYEVVGKETTTGAEGVYLASVNALEAGVPYIFEKTAGEIKVVYDMTEAKKDAQTVNGLCGYLGNSSATVEPGGYILLNDEFCPSDGSARVRAFRAYLNLADVMGGKPTQMPGRRYIGMSTKGENEATGFENITVPEGQVLKVIENGQLIIIRGGEMYNAQGVRL